MVASKIRKHRKIEENKRESRNVGIEHVDHFRGLLHLFSAQQVKVRIAMDISFYFFRVTIKVH